MLDFIYDSLDTVKKLKFPTLKQIAQLTAAIFVLVVVAGVYFIGVDTLLSGRYKAFYSAMTDDQTSPVEVESTTTGTATALEIPTAAVETPEVVETELPLTETAE